jgi:hypothetical protein
MHLVFQFWLYYSKAVKQNEISSQTGPTGRKEFSMTAKVYEYDTVIQEAEKKGGAYVAFPYDVREEFHSGRAKVHVEFDGEPYDGSVVNMGVKHPDGSICYIIGIRKDIRQKIAKQPGDPVHVRVQQR